MTRSGTTVYMREVLEENLGRDYFARRRGIPDRATATKVLGFDDVGAIDELLIDKSPAVEPENQGLERRQVLIKQLIRISRKSGPRGVCIAACVVGATKRGTTASQLASLLAPELHNEQLSYTPEQPYENELWDAYYLDSRPRYLHTMTKAGSVLRIVAAAMRTYGNNPSVIDSARAALSSNREPSTLRHLVIDGPIQKQVISALSEFAQRYEIGKNMSSFSPTRSAANQTPSRHWNPCRSRRKPPTF